MTRLQAHYKSLPNRKFLSKRIKATPPLRPWQEKDLEQMQSEGFVLGGPKGGAYSLTFLLARGLIVREGLNKFKLAKPLEYEPCVVKQYYRDNAVWDEKARKRRNGWITYATVKASKKDIETLPSAEKFDRWDPIDKTN